MYTHLKKDSSTRPGWLFVRSNLSRREPRQILAAFPGQLEPDQSASAEETIISQGVEN